MPRRRPQYSIPGQAADFNVLGSRYNIRRRPDEIFVEGRRVRRREINVRGGQTHIHVHTGRPRRRREAATPQIDFEARRREIDDAIGKRARQIALLANMPARTFEEAAEREQAIHAGTGRKVLTKIVDFQGEQRLITEKATARANEKISGLERRFGRQLNTAEKAAVLNGELKKVRESLMANDLRSKAHPIRGTIGLKQSNPLNVGKAWFLHPIKTIEKLLITPAALRKQGIGRQSKRGQIKSFRKDATRKSGAFAEIGGETRAIGIFTQYRGRVLDAFDEFRRTGNNVVFERAVKDAENWAQSQISGEGSLMSDYRTRRKAA
ncbi:MAG: hypothetical protein PHD95_05620 [Candidatus ainarchaeum sp.]|nr:hypothetical protein [Candidatus ainarchaeum sp.]